MTYFMIEEFLRQGSAKLFLSKGASAWIGLKPSKEEGIRGIIEEFVLGVATILVHGLAHDREINQRILQVLVSLVMTVGEDE